MGFDSQESLPELQSESPDYKNKTTGGHKLASIDRRNLDTAHFGDMDSAELESTINMQEISEVADGDQLFKSAIVNPSESKIEDEGLLNSLEKRMKILESDKSSYHDKSRMTMTELHTPRSQSGVSMSQQFPQNLNDNDFLDRLDQEIRATEKNVEKMNERFDQIRSPLSSRSGSKSPIRRLKL